MHKKEKRIRTHYYWQESINGIRNYVDGLEWLLERVKEVRYLEIYSIRPPGKAAKLMAYMEDGMLFFALFPSYEEASRFATHAQFNHSNKEIHST